MLRNDRLVGHDYPGVRGNGFVRWELDELELGARVAMALDDPEQWWWTLNAEQIEADLRSSAAQSSSASNGPAA